MSVNISDHDCAKYIIVEFMHVPGAGSRLQLSEMGKHCSRLAAKNAMVQVMTTPTIIHEMIENVLVKNILGLRSAYPNLPRRQQRKLPSIEKHYSKFCKSKCHRLR